MQRRTYHHPPIDLRTLSDGELHALAYEGRLSRADLVKVVAEMRRRQRRHGRTGTAARREQHDTPTGHR